jgi:hypothetical protein
MNKVVPEWSAIWNFFQRLLLQNHRYTQNASSRANRGRKLARRPVYDNDQQIMQTIQWQKLRKRSRQISLSWDTAPSGAAVEAELLA